jgi:membrane protein DedA with SNARE-associated domain
MSLSLTAAVARYGYFAVAVGAILEGESVLLAAGVAAHQGLLDLRLVMLVAAVASTLGDQTYFQIGRRWGGLLLDRFPPLARRAPQVRALITRYHTSLVLGIRFMIGLRIAGPLMMGWARVDPWRFAGLNALGAAVWAVLVASAGYGLSNAWASLADHPYGRAVLVLLLLLLAGFAVYRWRRASRPVLPPD